MTGISQLEATKVKTLKELVVISGKGGTGKTSITASFAVLSKNKIMVDCDVDAADLHLILKPEIQQKEIFKSGHEAVIRQEDCIGCGVCLLHCNFGAIQVDNDRERKRNVFQVDPIGCEGCGACVKFCPRQAIDFPERLSGEWYVSNTAFGFMVHAKLEIAGENSGKLVATVREQARNLAKEKKINQIIVDGPPGIGCPVIASVAGADHVLIVTEPTVSGLHDLERTVKLINHFKIAASVCINKFDLNLEMSKKIEEATASQSIPVVGRVRYDKTVTAAQIAGKTVVDYEDSPAASDVVALWKNVSELVGSGERVDA